MKKLILFSLIVLNTNVAINGFINVHVMNFSSKARVKVDYTFLLNMRSRPREFNASLDSFNIEGGGKTRVKIKINPDSFVSLDITLMYDENGTTRWYEKIISNLDEVYDGMLIMIYDKEHQKGITAKLPNDCYLLENFDDCLSIITMSEFDFDRYLGVPSAIYERMLSPVIDGKRHRKGITRKIPSKVHNRFAILTLSDE